jgi:hypothetical protein
MQECDGIYAAGDIAMQGVKPDAATAGLENGYRQEVVEIYQHRQQEDEVGLQPVGIKEPVRHECREDQVQEIVDGNLEYLHHKMFIRI